MKKRQKSRSIMYLFTLLMVCTSVLVVFVNTQAAGKKVTKISVTAKTKTLYVGGKYTLKVKGYTTKNVSKAFTFQTSNKKIATVNVNGQIIAKNKGLATITVTSRFNKPIKASCKVTVKQKVKKSIKVTNITLNYKKLSLFEGETKAMKVSVKPSNATNKNIIWKSSNTTVATINNGLVKAVKSGTSKITAAAADRSGKKAECIVTVKKRTDENHNGEGSSDGTTIDKDYKLVWEDDFNGTKLNANDWNYEYHEPGWVNNELQEYTDAPENIYVKDGKLVIKAKKTEDENGTYYTSGRINTQNKHDYKYGRFEVRAKVPSGKGFLPAFWMMPTDENLYGQWPKCGEIDIMEVLGSETNKTHGTLHFGEPHTQSQGGYTLTNGDFASEFHTYACEWEPNEIRFYVDGRLFYKENDWFTKKTGFGEVTYPAPYDQPFYLILNLAVGGNWPGNPDETTKFGENAQLTVDYVKVYQKESYDENVTKPVVNLIFREPDETGNYVINGDFKETESLWDKEKWELLLSGEGQATGEISENAIHISTEDAGNLDYSVQLVQGQLPMIQGNKYRFSFDAYGAENRTMITSITAPDKGYKRYLADTSVLLTTEKKHYSYELDMMDKGDINGRVEFNLGNQGSTAKVMISNVRFEKVGVAEIPQDEKTVLPDGNYVYNGDFQQGSNRMDYWSVDSQIQGIKALVTNIDNRREFQVEIPNTVKRLDQVILKQDSIGIDGNKTYTLSFDGYADGNKEIQSVIAGKTFDTQLTEEKTTFRYKFTTDPEMKGSVLQFLLGQEGKIHIDNVRIQEDSLLINGDFYSGMTGYEVYAYTSSDVTYVVDELNEDK